MAASIATEAGSSSAVRRQFIGRAPAVRRQFAGSSPAPNYRLLSSSRCGVWALRIAAMDAATVAASAMTATVAR